MHKLALWVLLPVMGAMAVTMGLTLQGVGSELDNIDGMLWLWNLACNLLTLAGLLLIVTPVALTLVEKNS